MGQRMTWEEMKKAYPDEWLAVVNYTSNDVGDVDGEVVYHSNDKDDFYRHAKEVIDRYGGMAMRYTGELIKNPQGGLRHALSSAFNPFTQRIWPWRPDSADAGKPHSRSHLAD